MPLVDKVKPSFIVAVNPTNGVIFDEGGTPGVRSMKIKRSGILVAAALLCGLILVYVGAEYSITHPFPDDYDETHYINEVCADRSVAIKQGLAGFAKHLVSEDRWRPPGYRLAGFLGGIAGEPSPTILRSLSLLSLFVTALLLFLSGKEISSTNAGILWASVFAFSAGAFLAVLNFGTEITLFPALAGCLYGVARWFHKVRPDPATVGVLALSTALGSLSKVTFFSVFVPLIGAAVLLAPETDERRRSLVAILGAVAAGILVTIPWWLANWWSALGFAYWSSHYPGLDFPWLREAATSLLGVPFAVGFLIFLGWVLVRANSLWKVPNRTTWNFVVVCLTGCLPSVAFHIASVNHMMRLLTPALIPAIGVVAVLLDLKNLLKNRLLNAFIALLLVIQTGTIAWPISHWVPDPWDWRRLRELARAHGLPNPTIVHLGYAPTFNPPQIKYPWICHDDEVFEQWLWAHQDRPIDWSKINKQIEQADIVLTAPGSLFASPPDAQNNDELARRLHERAGEWTPVTLYFGLDNKTPILVFFRNLPHGE
jgi:hypothetical protein